MLCTCMIEYCSDLKGHLVFCGSMKETRYHYGSEINHEQKEKHNMMSLVCKVEKPNVLAVDKMEMTAGEETRSEE